MINNENPGLERTFLLKNFEIKTWFKVFRIHQWLKNLLLFVPIFSAHQFTHLKPMLQLMLAFLSFSLCASSVYIINDLLDLQNDRLHPRKRYRPFASGQIPIWIGVMLAPILVAISFGLSSYIGREFFICLGCYFIFTSMYSIGLKKLILIDCLTLAILYTLRIIAGAVTVHLSLSFWLLTFAIFLFLSLAFVKRYAELEFQVLHGKHKVHGRGYYTSDAALIQTLGITAGYSAILVLALYIKSENIQKLYKSPQIIWGTLPIMVFWISWIWMQAHRGKMHDDPVVFAIRDKVSLLSGFAFVSIMISGAVGWPW